MHELGAILDAIHTALLDGDIDAVGPLTGQLEAGLARAGTLSDQALETVRSKAVRNARTLEAAMRGVRSAQRRLAELQEAAAGHRTYARDGHRAVAASPFPTLRQRV